MRLSVTSIGMNTPMALTIRINAEMMWMRAEPWIAISLAISPGSPCPPLMYGRYIAIRRVIQSVPSVKFKGDSTACTMLISRMTNGKNEMTAQVEMADAMV